MRRRLKHYPRYCRINVWASWDQNCIVSGISTKNNLVYSIDRRGHPYTLGTSPSTFSWNLLSTEDTPVILVHGFHYDPWALDYDNPHFVGPLGDVSTFGLWKRNLVPDRNSIGFGWYSLPRGFHSWIKAWIHRRYNPYRYSFDLAWEAGGVLASMISEIGEVDVLCHSLGSRVVLAALDQVKDLPMRNLVIMNGAELAIDGERVAKKNPQANITNLVVRSDRVLKHVGAIFAPKGGLYEFTLGQRPLKNAPPNWKDVDLDHLGTQAWGRKKGWDLQGNNPDSIGDHWFTYKHPGNRGLIRTALKMD